jgi:hypothetical protein
MITPQPMCMICKNFDKKSFPLSCKAFPKGIPTEIFSGTVQHTTPYKGDGGVLFIEDTSIDDKTRSIVKQQLEDNTEDW